MSVGRVGFVVSVLFVGVIVGWLYLVRSELVSLTRIDEFLAQHRQFLESFLSPTPPPTIASSPTLVPSKTAPIRRSSPVPTAEVSEVDLWDALRSYRSSHQRTSLEQDEALCSYARERVKEHIERFKTLSSDQEPLDAHVGFKRDADSGALFERTGFPAVSENLAYLPHSMTATQIIEWGWDTSTSHREAQLSNDWTHGCIVGTRPFYAAIFARR